VRTRKASVLAVAASVVVATATGGAVVMSSAEQSTAVAQDTPANTAKVRRGKLSAVVSQDGTLTYRARPDGSPYSVFNRAGGTYTELPENGDEVRCGDALYRVDDNAVLLLCGRLPAYRDLDEGDRGGDVRQLNRNLRKLGYGVNAGVDFTWRTKEALKELQRDRGLDATGALDVDGAVFLPESVRIARVTGEPGGSARPGGQVAQATSDTLEVQVNLDASQQGEVKKGDRARITLPGNRSVNGKVDRLGRVALAPAGQGGNAGGATIPAFIGLDEPRKARGLDSAPVHVDIMTVGVKSALSVPVTALVGKAGGGYAVEVVRDGGRRELVAVELGLFDATAGRVQVGGDVNEGDQVVLPSP
jgi:peptidoglycan hydrolase-like protein with peptidoglycan-binding domain